MEMAIAEDDTNNIDAKVDIEIASCLRLQSPKSFFLFAGAGSGKTRSLINALQYLQNNFSRNLRLRGQRIGVITYTNKACDEIKHRIDFDPLFEVSTIHSFVWKLIQGFNEDIKSWLKNELQEEIANLQEKEAKVRSRKASLDHNKSIDSKTKRLAALSEVKKFQYSPNGNNRGCDSLNHSEAIKIAAFFLSEKPTMQQLLITKFPILLIDESQDTNKMLMDAFMSVQSQYSGKFMLGLFGDTMQRIYADGKANLSDNLPTDWVTPTKKMNHRCPRRVVTLINMLRASADNKVQIPRTNATEGFVRLFILNTSTFDKLHAEKLAAQKMAAITGDIGWNRPDAVKTLILEHHMAAKRMGFLEMYEPLYRNDNLRIGLLDGTLSGLKFFTDRILPLVESKKKNDLFAVASIIRKHSPLLNKSVLYAAEHAQAEQVHKARDAVEELWSLWLEGQKPRFIDILRNVAKTGLFEIPESLRPIAARSEEEQGLAETEIAGRISADGKSDETALDNWDEFLTTPFEQVKPYADYVSGKACFDTHHGVKGLEFPRVMVIIDDSAARGFLFSYDKLFGIKEKTRIDLENESAGKETSIDRTRRLFYVICSRAEESLAIIAYSDDPQAVKDNLILQGWFQKNEVEII